MDIIATCLSTLLDYVLHSVPVSVTWIEQVVRGLIDLQSDETVRTVSSPCLIQIMFIVISYVEAIKQDFYATDPVQTLDCLGRFTALFVAE